jgi:two-component system nitrogen regulation sensor histidine kinase NtrY
MKALTENEKGKPISIDQLDSEDIQDINMAASAIKKRSDGLLEFVKDYRTISSVPIPKRATINVKEFLGSIELLMKPLIDEANVALKILPIPANASINVDSKLIEQVLINLINNSIHALNGREQPSIKISCIVEPERTVIVITDNGMGIEEKIMSQIFIPFYTTKKHGSGIGLSLSKNILKKHGGNLLVSSEVGKYTTFSMVFKN